MRFALGETDFEECGVIQKVLRNEDYQQTSDAYHEALRALRQTLNAEQMEAYLKLTDKSDIFFRTVGHLVYRQGFRAGLRLGIDISKEK